MSKLNNIYKYVNAWLLFLSDLFKRLANVGAVVADSFNGLHIPQKNDYFGPGAESSSSA